MNPFAFHNLSFKCILSTVLAIILYFFLAVRALSSSFQKVFKDFCVIGNSFLIPKLCCFHTHSKYYPASIFFYCPLLKESLQAITNIKFSQMSGSPKSLISQEAQKIQIFPSKVHIKGFYLIFFHWYIQYNEINIKCRGQLRFLHCWLPV